MVNESIVIQPRNALLNNSQQQILMSTEQLRIMETALGIIFTFTFAFSLFDTFNLIASWKSHFIRLYPYACLSKVFCDAKLDISRMNGSKFAKDVGNISIFRWKWKSLSQRDIFKLKSFRWIFIVFPFSVVDLRQIAFARNTLRGLMGTVGWIIWEVFTCKLNRD